MFSNQSYKMVSQDSEPLKIQLKDDTGLALNLTGASGFLTIAQVTQPDPTQIICQKTLTIVDAANGIIQVDFLPADTKGVAGIFPYDVVINFSDGTRKTVIMGKFEIVANVTP